MGLGILEPLGGGHVPGTVLLDQNAAHSEETTNRLRHGTGKNAHIVLAPQPSQDPNDPLNWPLWKRNLVFSIIVFGVMIHGVVPNPLLNAGIVQIAIGFGRPITDISKLNSYLPLATGAVALFVSAFGRKFGKRPVYAVSSILGVIGVIVGETASGYETLLASRVIQGAAVAAYESLAIASVGDLFFVHERGPRIAILIFFLSAISNGVSIIAGVITSNLGWHYNFHISMPFAALQTILVILFVPETMYRRDAIYEIDTVGSDEKYTNGADTKSTDAAEIEHVLTPGMIQPRKTFIQELKLYNGTFVDDSIWKMLLACPAILLNMGALYQILVTGITIAWYVGIAVITSVIFASPPYLLSSASVGYMSAGPLIGGFFGALFCFLLSEPLLKWLTRRNAGVYEPEFCLLPLSIGCLTTVGGLIGWGYAVERADSIYAACFVWALMLFGMTVIASFSTQYALDAFRSYSTEIFIMNMTFKNFFYYGLINYIIQWYMQQGGVDVVGVMSGLTSFLCVLAIPLYIFGKRYRTFWNRYNVIKILHLETDHTGAE